MGVTDQEIYELSRFRESALFSESETVSLEYAEGVPRTPVEVSDELFARLRRHFSDDQIVELTAIIAFENFRARFDHA